MQICLRTQINYYFNQKMDSIRHIQKELSAQYLYKDEREHLIKTLDKLKDDTQDQITFMIDDLEMIKGEFGNLF